MTRSFKFASAIFLVTASTALTFGQKPNNKNNQSVRYVIEELRPPQSPVYSQVPIPERSAKADQLGNLTQTFWEATIRYSIYLAHVKSLKSCDPNTTWRTGACVMNEAEEYKSYEKAYARLAETWTDLLSARNNVVADLNKDVSLSPEQKRIWLKYTDDLADLLKEKYGFEVQSEYDMLMRTKKPSL